MQFKSVRDVSKIFKNGTLRVSDRNLADLVPFRRRVGPCGQGPAPVRLNQFNPLFRSQQAQKAVVIMSRRRGSQENQKVIDRTHKEFPRGRLNLQQAGAPSRLKTSSESMWSCTQMRLGLLSITCRLSSQICISRFQFSHSKSSVYCAVKFDPKYDSGS